MVSPIQCVSLRQGSTMDAVIVQAVGRQYVVIVSFPCFSVSWATIPHQLGEGSACPQRSHQVARAIDHARKNDTLQVVAPSELHRKLCQLARCDK